MSDIKVRIEKAILVLDQAVHGLAASKAALEKEVESLKQENGRLQQLTKSAISQIDNYLIELEEIRRNHGSRNDSN